MRAEIVAVGTELLLGQIVDTNSTTIAGELAASGIECHFQTRVGDNLDRIASALRGALARADAVIVCGGLGPTQDDITREAIARVMDVELRRDPEALVGLERAFSVRAMSMPVSNFRQADVPEGATLIPQRVGTAPGLICPVGDGVIYALPGVPHEMEEMLARAVIPDLKARSGDPSVIVSRTVCTAGISESRLAELVAPMLDALDSEGAGAPTIAFLANIATGVKVRVTVKAVDISTAERRLAQEEAKLRTILGDAVFGTDHDTIESAVGALLAAQGLTLAVAESFTGGVIASRIVDSAGASNYFKGGVVSYDSQVKFSVLQVRRGPVISGSAASEMAEGVRKLLDSDVAIATTGVAGPDSLEGHQPGTAFVATAIAGRPTKVVEMTLAGSRTRIRDSAALRAMNLLRLRLISNG